MKVKNIFMLFFFLLAALMVGCEDYVREIASPEDRINDELLNSESQADFLIKGVQASISDATDFAIIMSDLLADQLVFSDNADATYPSFDEVDDAEILRDNNSVDTYWENLHTMRFLGDDLADRATNRIDWTDDAKKNETLFWANFAGGYARYLLAVHWGLTENQPGGVINKSEFIPKSEMLVLAREKFAAALAAAPSDYYQRVINTFMAKTYIAENNYSEAATYAQNGMVDGDAPFETLYSTQSDNYLWQQAGVLRTQCTVDPRFQTYIDNEATEANRIQIEAFDEGGNTYYRQLKYPQDISPIALVTWQENELILAEIELLGNSNPNAALTHVNNVRASHGIPDLGAVDRTVLIEERDKELFLTGNRLVDEVRFDIFHNVPGPWRHLPITDREINGNPNLDI